MRFKIPYTKSFQVRHRTSWKNGNKIFKFFQCALRRETIYFILLTVHFFHVILFLFYHHFYPSDVAGSGGLIAVNAVGEYSMEFNSKGMFRGVCESSGQCSVGIWEDMRDFKVAEIALTNTEIDSDSVESKYESNSEVERAKFTV